MLIDINAELKRIDTYLDTLESMHDEDFLGKVTTFVYKNILVGEDPPPIMYQCAANYLHWALQKPQYIQGRITKSCKCVGGWVMKKDNSAYPCERCNTEAHDKWWTEYVDEQLPPA